MVQKELGEYYRYFESIIEIESLFGIQARIPYIYDIH